MAKYERGETVKCQITITDNDGNPYDPITLALTIYDPAGVANTTIATIDGLTRASEGVYYYPFEVPADAMYGDWRYVFTPGTTGDVIAYKYFTVAPQVHTTLATTDDVYKEANIDSSVISTDIVAQFITEAEDILKLRTNRTSFTGSAANMAQTAVVYMVIDRLSGAKRDKMMTAISRIKENDSEIEFKNGRTLSEYRSDIDYYVSQLKLRKSHVPAIYTIGTDTNNKGSWY